MAASLKINWCTCFLFRFSPTRKSCGITWSCLHPTRGMKTGNYKIFQGFAAGFLRIESTDVNNPAICFGTENRIWFGRNKIRERSVVPISGNNYMGLKISFNTSLIFKPPQPVSVHPSDQIPLISSMIEIFENKKTICLMRFAKTSRPLWNKRFHV